MRGDIYWFTPRDSQGGEQRKRRPCVEIGHNKLAGGSTRLIVPTSTRAILTQFRASLVVDGAKTIVKCDQIRDTSVEFLETWNVIRRWTESEADRIEEALKNALDLRGPLW